MSLSLAKIRQTPFLLVKQIPIYTAREVFKQIEAWQQILSSIEEVAKQSFPKESIKVKDAKSIATDIPKMSHYIFNPGDSKYELFGAYYRGALEGILICRYKEKEPLFHIEALLTNPKNLIASYLYSEKVKGVGSILIKQAVARAAGLRYKSIMLLATPSSLSFYYGHNFRHKYYDCEQTLELPLMA